MENNKFNLFKKIFVVCASGITTLLVLIFMIKSAIDGNVFYDGGFEFDEQFVYFLYAALSILICGIVDLLEYIKNLRDNKLAKNVGPALASAFLLGYYSKIFFKALNKKGTAGFSSINLLFVVILLSLTIYTFLDLAKYILDRNAQKKEINR